MNLRQKVKKYKQRCNQLESMLLPTRTIHHTEVNRGIIKLKYKHNFHPEAIDTMGIDAVENIIKYSFANELKDKIYDLAAKEVKIDKYRAVAAVTLELSVIDRSNEWIQAET